MINLFVVAGGKGFLQQCKLSFVILCERVLFFDAIDGMDAQTSAIDEPRPMQPVREYGRPNSEGKLK
ncbi:hypothetical protein [uncultured Ruegeria sp.]|uniref:hypothetical protein n=1 Tax=uncultured Ruegeria sp. TaxID=259304 RepID=UPI00262A010A|nr:hypothetical protein [uncultured Ruegeria sp.]